MKVMLSPLKFFLTQQFVIFFYNEARNSIHLKKMNVTFWIQVKSWAALAVFCFSLVSISTFSEEVDEFDFGNTSFEAAAAGDSTPAEEREGSESLDKRTLVYAPAALAFNTFLQPANCLKREVALTFVTYCVGKSLYLVHRAVLL